MSFLSHVIKTQRHWNTFLRFVIKRSQRQQNPPEYFGTAVECILWYRPVPREWSRAAARGSSWRRAVSKVHSWRGSAAQVPWPPKTPWTETGGPPGSGRSLEHPSPVIFRNLRKRTRICQGGENGSLVTNANELTMLKKKNLNFPRELP